MTQANTAMSVVARWLVVLMTGFMVLSAPVFADAPSAPTKRCDASCAARCPCCVSKPAPASPLPLAPAAPRVAVEKDFQISTLFVVLLTLPSEFGATAFLNDSPCALRSQAPLYQRHCAYLI
jgi:hypothetical protein